MKSPDVFQHAGLRNTKAREIVLKVLHEASKPLSHMEISKHESLQSLNRVTLYRTLATLQHLGFLHRVQGTDGVWRHCAHPRQANGCNGNHLHFFCIECDEMMCLPEQALPRVEAPEGAQILGKQLLVYGICKGCHSRKDGEEPSK